MGRFTTRVEGPKTRIVWNRANEQIFRSAPVVARPELRSVHQGQKIAVRAPRDGHHVSPDRRWVQPPSGRENTPQAVDDLGEISDGAGGIDRHDEVVSGRMGDAIPQPNLRWFERSASLTVEEPHGTRPGQQVIERAPKLDGIEVITNPQTLRLSMASAVQGVADVVERR